MATCTLPTSACPCIGSLARAGGISIVTTAPMVDYKIHRLKMMPVPESRAIVGRRDGINGRDRTRLRTPRSDAHLRRRLARHRVRVSSAHQDSRSRGKTNLHQYAHQPSRRRDGNSSRFPSVDPSTMRPPRSIFPVRDRTGPRVVHALGNPSQPKLRALSPARVHAARRSIFRRRSSSASSEATAVPATLVSRARSSLGISC